MELEQFEDENIRKYTKKRLKKNSNQINFFLRKLSATNWLIIINVVIFFLTYILTSIYGTEFSDKLYSLVAISANSFFNGYFWTVFTSIFMHAGPLHLFVNMFSLFFLGNFIERLIGRKRFFWLYIISGIFAGLFFVILSYFFGGICIFNVFNSCLGSRLFGSPDIAAVGASGAIFALVGLLALLTPKNRVYLLAGPLIAIVVEAVLASFFGANAILSVLSTLINIYVIFSIFAIFSFNPVLRKISFPVEMPFWVLPFIAIAPLIAIGLFVDLPIGNMAHLGGLIAGLIYAHYLKKKYKKKTEMIGKIFSR